MNPQGGIKGEATPVADPLCEPISRVAVSAGSVSDSVGCVSVELQHIRKGLSKAIESCGSRLYLYFRLYPSSFLETGCEFPMDVRTSHKMMNKMNPKGIKARPQDFYDENQK